MDEAKEKKPPLDREEFKLLTENERRFIENPIDLLTEYKSPDAMARQYNNRIKYRAINAIRELAWLCDKLPDDQLNKILSEENIGDNIFQILDKALGLAAKRKPDIKKIAWNREGGIVEEDTPVSGFLMSELRTCMKKWMQYIMPADYLEAHKKLKKDYYLNPMLVLARSIETRNNLADCLQFNEKMHGFIEEEGLREKFESKKRQNFENEVRNALKSAGWADEKISDYLKRVYPEY